MPDKQLDRPLAPVVSSRGKDLDIRGRQPLFFSRLLFDDRLQVRPQPLLGGVLREAGELRLVMPPIEVPYPGNAFFRQPQAPQRKAVLRRVQADVGHFAAVEADQQMNRRASVVGLAGRISPQKWR